MGIQVFETYGNYNPSGIVINPGYYALTEAIRTKRSIYDIMRRWFGIKEEYTKIPRRKKRMCKPHKKKHPSPISDQIVKLYTENKSLRNIEIAELVGCTPRMVCIALRKIGVRRNRWDGHISTDPRNKKRKRRTKNEKTV